MKLTLVRTSSQRGHLITIYHKLSTCKTWFPKRINDLERAKNPISGGFPIEIETQISKLIYKTKLFHDIKIAQLAICI